MKIILSDKQLNKSDFPDNVKIKSVSVKTMENFEGNPDVVAIAGSRAMATKAEGMDFPSLKLFQLTSAGFDGVPIKEYRDKNIDVANAGTTYSTPIAETVVLGVLLMAKKLRKNPNNRHFKYTRHYSEITELADKNVLVMGAGNIGTAVANRLLAFEMNIDGYDIFRPCEMPYKNIYRNRGELLENIAKYDYIVSTLPDNDDTKKFIDEDLFRKMKQTAVIINVGRKAVFNEEDFYSALKSKKIGGAVLDMFEKIPNPIQNKFRRLSNVIVLPGVAAISQEVNVRLRKHITKNLLAMLDGEPVSNVIN